MQEGAYCIDEAQNKVQCGALVNNNDDYSNNNMEFILLLLQGWLTRRP
jgi:hypothetical protein